VKDKVVVVLESRAGQQLVEALTRRGATAVWAPALAELPQVDLVEIRALVLEWDSLSPALAVFQTGVGTTALFAATDTLDLTEQLLHQLSQTRVISRSPKPFVALRRRNVRVDVSAASPFTTNEVLAAIANIPIAGRTVMIQRYGASNTELLEALLARGALPREITTYEWAIPADHSALESSIQAIIAGTVDAVVFTSAAQVRNLLTVAAASGRSIDLLNALKTTVNASIGPVCSAQLRQQGIVATLEADPPKLGPLVSALEAALSVR
jgi:uroporphyrinogen-III synthase